MKISLKPFDWAFVGYLTIILLAHLVALSCDSAEKQVDSNFVVGTWVSEEDSNYQRTFTSGNKCLEYYNDDLIDVFQYSIVDDYQDNGDLFLKLIDIELKDEYYFEITSDTDSEGTLLSVMNTETGRINLYVRKK